MPTHPILLLLLCSFASCVSYERQAADIESTAATVASRTGGTYSVDTAIDLSLRQNPRLRALTASVRAADANTIVAVTLRAEWRERMDAIEAVIDPIALLGLGPRGAAIGTAEAKLLEAVAALAVQRWQTIAAVVEEFAVHAALCKLEVANLQLDVDAFERAGLASPVAAQQLRAAQARSHSETVELQRAFRNNLSRLRELLGLPGNAQLTLLPIDEHWLQQPAGIAQELLRRPDLALATARFEVADAEFKKAVMDQYPTIQIGPNISLMGDPLRAMAMIQIPFGMHGLAEAARERREASRADLETAFLRASREAELSDQDLAAANAVAAATSSGLEARIAVFAAARAALEVEVDAFAMLANSASMVMGETMENRQAAIAQARAKVQRAVAYGGPRTPLQQLPMEPLPMPTERTPEERAQ